MVKQITQLEQVISPRIPPAAPSVPSKGMSRRRETSSKGMRAVRSLTKPFHGTQKLG